MKQAILTSIFSASLFALGACTPTSEENPAPMAAVQEVIATQTPAQVLEKAQESELVEEILFAAPDATFTTLLPKGHRAGEPLSKGQTLALLRRLDQENDSISEVIALTEKLEDDGLLIAEIVPRLCLACGAHQGATNDRDLKMITTYIVAKALGNELCARSAYNDLQNIKDITGPEGAADLERMLKGALAKYPL